MYYQKLIFVFFIGFSTFFSSCEKDLDCEGIIWSKELGHMKPKDSSLLWLPVPHSSFTFINSKGFVARFVNGERDDYSFEADRRYVEVDRKNQCETYEYYSITRTDLLSKSEDVALFFRYELEKDIDRYDVFADTFNMDKVDDIFSIRFNNIYWYQHLSEDSLAKAKILDTITLGGITYQQVFHFTKQYESGIFPRDVYFIKGKGIIGFTLTNNEEWYLKP